MATIFRRRFLIISYLKIFKKKKKKKDKERFLSIFEIKSKINVMMVDESINKLDHKSSLQN